MQEIISFLKDFVTNSIGDYGLFAVFFLMALESACIPVPSEVIMLFAGFQVAEGRMSLWEATAAGALGNLVGSWAAYGVGRYGGRSVLEKYGKYVLLSHKKLELAERWWNRHGDPAVFFSRLLPIVRTFISLPAGIGRMRFLHFTIYTLIGCIPWSLMLAYVGMRMGENWEAIYEKLHLLDYPVLAGLALTVLYFVWRWRRKKGQASPGGGDGAVNNKGAGE